MIFFDQTYRKIPGRPRSALEISEIL